MRRIISLMLFLAVTPFSGAKLLTSDTGIAGYRVLKKIDMRDQGLRTSFVSAIMRDRSAGKYWIVTEIGLSLFDEKNGIWSTARLSEIGAPQFEDTLIAQSGDGTIWVGVRESNPVAGNGVLRYDGVRWQRLSNNDIPLPSEPTSKLTSPLSTFIEGRDGTVWFICLDGFVGFDGAKWTTVKRFPNACASRSRFSGGVVDLAGDVWLAGLRCIIRFSPASNEFKVFQLPKELSEGANLAYEDGRGRLWFADDQGHLAVYDKSTDSWTKHSILNNIQALGALINSSHGLLFVRAVVDDHAGNVLIGTSQGLVVYQENENRWQLFTPSNSILPSAAITTIVEDSIHRLWIGTSNGIVVLGKD